LPQCSGINSVLVNVQHRHYCVMQPNFKPWGKDTASMPRLGPQFRDADAVLTDRQEPRPRTISIALFSSSYCSVCFHFASSVLPVIFSQLSTSSSTSWSDYNQRINPHTEYTLCSIDNIIT